MSIGYADADKGDERKIIHLLLLSVFPKRVIDVFPVVRFWTSIYASKLHFLKANRFSSRRSSRW